MVRPRFFRVLPDAGFTVPPFLFLTDNQTAASETPIYLQPFSGLDLSVPSFAFFVTRERRLHCALTGFVSHEHPAVVNLL